MSARSHAVAAHLREVLRVPEVPGDRYQIRERVGEGGMGVVYRAFDRLLGREVALKVVRPDADPEAFTHRLRREAEILARLEHPGIVPVHDAGVLADGRAFYVMKLVRGGRLDEVAAGQGRAATLRLLLRVCDAVASAHAQGIVHRDLKPANVMIGPFGEVLVLDWGIARILREPGEGPAVPGTPPANPAQPDDTAPGAALGTPGFMAPEQGRGDGSQVDTRADIFALGEVLRTLAGPDAPPALRAIVARAKAGDPAARYPTVEAFAADVAAFLDGLPVAAYREPVSERLARLYGRYQTPILLVVAYLVMRLLFLALRGL